MQGMWLENVKEVHGLEKSGFVIKETINGVIIENDGETYLVHNDELGRPIKHWSKRGVAYQGKRFDLEESQKLKLDPNHTSWRQQYAY